MLCVPAVRLEVLNVAVPELSVPVPSLVPPSRNVTVPVGVPPLDVIFPEKVTASPAMAGLSDDVTVAVVAAAAAGGVVGAWHALGLSSQSLPHPFNVTNKGTTVKANIAPSSSGLRFRHLQRIMPNIPSPLNADNTIGDLWPGLMPKGSCNEAPTVVVVTVS